MTDLTHPEWVNGRKLWMDGSVRYLIDRIRFGDPLLGWEGDERIELYYDGGECRFELWRLEDDHEYRRICRSQPFMAFDERVIHALIEWDGRRRHKTLFNEVAENNERVQAQLDAEHAEWINEELAPRMQQAFRKDA